MTHLSPALWGNKSTQWKESLRAPIASTREGKGRRGKPHNEYLEISQFFKHECQFNTVHLLIKPTGFMLRNITVWVIPLVLYIAAEFSGQLFIDRQT